MVVLDVMPSNLGSPPCITTQNDVYSGICIVLSISLQLS